MELVKRKTSLPSLPSPRVKNKPHPQHHNKEGEEDVMPWILQRKDRGCYRTLLDELITTDIPGYRNFVRMPPAVFDRIQERISHRLRKEETIWRTPLQVGLKLAATLRHLSTGESYTSLQPPWSSLYQKSAEPYLLSSRKNTSAAPQKKMTGMTGMCHMPLEPWMAHCHEEAKEVRQ